MGQAYLDNGLEGLQEKPHSGRPHRLTDEQKSQLKEYVIEHAVNESCGRLQAKDIGFYIESNFNTSYKKSALYQLLHDMGLSWITTRSKDPNQSVEVQEAFKKFPIETILKIPGHVPLKDVQIWFQDEARFGQRNTTTRIWAEKGTRPRVVQQ